MEVTRIGSGPQPQSPPAVGSPVRRKRRDEQHRSLEERELTADEDAWSKLLCGCPQFLADAMEACGEHVALQPFDGEADCDERLLDRDGADHAGSDGASPGNVAPEPDMWSACLLDPPPCAAAICRAFDGRPAVLGFTVRSLRDGRAVGLVRVAGNAPGDLRTNIDFLVAPLPYARLLQAGRAANGGVWAWGRAQVPRAELWAGAREVAEGVALAVRQVWAAGYARVEVQLCARAAALRRALLAAGLEFEGVRARVPRARGRGGARDVVVLRALKRRSAAGAAPPAVSVRPSARLPAPRPLPSARAVRPTAAAWSRVAADAAEEGEERLACLPLRDAFADGAVLRGERVILEPLILEPLESFSTVLEPFELAQEGPLRPSALARVLDRAPELRAPRGAARLVARLNAEARAPGGWVCPAPGAPRPAPRAACESAPRRAG